MLDHNQSWTTYEQIRKDSRIRFAEEVHGLEAEWEKATIRERSPAAQLWTDAYLLAFARVAEMNLVTFDHALAKIDERRVCLLPPAKIRNFC